MKNNGLLYKLKMGNYNYYNNYTNKEFRDGFSYKGGIDEFGLPHGRGILKLKDKFSFNGFWRNGKPIGYAEIYHNEGLSNDRLGNYSKVLFNNGIVSKIYTDDIAYRYYDLPDCLVNWVNFFHTLIQQLPEIFIEPYCSINDEFV